MTPGRLYLFCILALVLSGLLLFTSDTALANALGSIALGLALVAYLLGLYMARIGRRGDAALRELQVRVAAATGRQIQGEFRTYLREGLEGVPAGELLLFYQTEQGWLLVPLLDELSWIEVPGHGVRSADLHEWEASEPPGLKVELETASGRELKLSLTSTLVDAQTESLGKAEDLHALREALRAGVS